MPTAPRASWAFACLALAAPCLASEAPPAAGDTPGTWAFLPARDPFRPGALLDLRHLNERPAGCSIEPPPRRSPGRLVDRLLPPVRVRQAPVGAEPGERPDIEQQPGHFLLGGCGHGRPLLQDLRRAEQR